MFDYGPQATTSQVLPTYINRFYSGAVLHMVIYVITAGPLIVGSVALFGSAAELLVEGSAGPVRLVTAALLVLAAGLSARPIVRWLTRQDPVPGSPAR